MTASVSSLPANAPTTAFPPTSGLSLVADAVMGRPGFEGPERTPDELAATRPTWLTGLLAEFPALRALVRERSREACRSLSSSPPPDNYDEALCRLMLHSDTRVGAAAARIAFPERPSAPNSPENPDTSAGSGDKRTRNLERRLAVSQERRRRAEGKLKHLRAERDRALAAASRETERSEETAEETDQARTEVQLLRAEHSEPRVLGRRLVRLWDTSGSPRHGDPRERGRTSSEGAARKALRAAADVANIDVDDLINALRDLADPRRRDDGNTARIRVGAERAPRVVQLGGGTEIGGSCVLVEAGSTRILVDAGTRQGRPGDHPAPPGLADLAPGPVSAVVVTHAHNDHAGYVPALWSDHGPFPVVATPATAELLPTMWTDTARVARRLADRRPGGNGAPYNQEQVQKVGAALVPLETGVERVVGDLTVELFPSGHVVGAAGVVVRAGGHRTVISGDIADFAQASVGACELPSSARGADLLVLESTCCDQSMAHRDHTVRRMLDTVAQVCGDG
ncbi:MBL fold metallo-hydrolase, partial [Bacillus mobilis]